MPDSYELLCEALQVTPDPRYHERLNAEIAQANANIAARERMIALEQARLTQHTTQKDGLRAFTLTGYYKAPVEVTVLYNVLASSKHRAIRLMHNDLLLKEWGIPHTTKSLYSVPTTMTVEETRYLATIY